MQTSSLRISPKGSGSKGICLNSQSNDLDQCILSINVDNYNDVAQCELQVKRFIV